MRKNTRSRSRSQRAGAIRMPGEYFGSDSGRYTPNPNAGLCANAYGNTTAQSMGNSLTPNMVGPNLFAHPNGTGTQTGGRRIARKSRKTRKVKRNGCSKGKGCSRVKRSGCSKGKGCRRVKRSGCTKRSGCSRVKRSGCSKRKGCRR